MNRLLGGDSGYYYVGEYSADEKTLRISAKIVKHDPTAEDAFGDRSATFTVEAVNHDLDPRWPLIRRLERLRYDLAHCAVPPDASTGLPSVQLAKAPGRIS